MTRDICPDCGRPMGHIWLIGSMGCFYSGERDCLRVQLAARDAEIARLREAAQALVAKMDIIHEDSRYKAVWWCWQNHGGPYTGPTYEAELNALRAALDAGKEGEG